MDFEITKGKIQSAQKVVLYGPEGIGKSTFASQFPSPLFIDTEGSTKQLDVARLPKPQTWNDLMQETAWAIQNTDKYKTLVIDTMDWAEALCIRDICTEREVSSIEDIGYGKGYVMIMEKMQHFLRGLDTVIARGNHVLVTAHAMMRKFEQPDEIGAYDRWELKLQKKTSPIVKEWADMLLFANYKTIVSSVKEGLNETNKAQGGKRVMYTSHHPCWDAKNRHGLEPCLDFSYNLIKNIFCEGEN